MENQDERAGELPASLRPGHGFKRLVGWLAVERDQAIILALAGIADFHGELVDRGPGAAIGPIIEAADGFGAGEVREGFGIGEGGGAGGLKDGGGVGLLRAQASGEEKETKSSEAGSAV